MTFLEIEKEIKNLHSGEKAQLFHLLAMDISKNFPGIEKLQGVCGGSACVVRTRIPIWSLEYCRRNGLSEAQILFDYPTLRAADLVSAWGYVSLNQLEIDKEIQENLDA
ncbi:MAG TPA: DUF433 domain-containing protein [Leptospiraceae bacterium]|nr:DUF433 domain-containing protein [Leptospiraceae bacterium]HMW05761.1 DUF433 domain-containing protein [Leptospiraceae bacterium]HMX33855.1 DUF433 domain-containing protein [Leptospiraceae bacterium]HMY33364.1 DUF433 domain-containing protein [Leptospiraceae bacterium]HMZ65437.1 DUF433 domain-containing protein [Leptospiraceae bacterium]